MRQTLIAATALASLTACATTPAEKAWDPAGKQGLVVVEAEPVGPILREHAAYDLGIGAFSPETGQFHAGPLGGWVWTGAMGKGPNARRYFIGAAQPGTYAIQQILVGHWGVCFNGGTKMFDVAPGAVTFVGRIDPNPSLLAIMRGHLPTLARQGQYFYVFDTPRPALTTPEQNPGWEAELKTYLSALPAANAPLRAAVLRDATFNTGRDLFGISKLCGGYFAKPKVPPAG
jgi:hypothetical protein